MRVLWQGLPLFDKLCCINDAGWHFGVITVFWWLQVIVKSFTSHQPNVTNSHQRTAKIYIQFIIKTQYAFISSSWNYFILSHLHRKITPTELKCLGWYINIHQWKRNRHIHGGYWIPPVHLFVCPGIHPSWYLKNSFMKQNTDSNLHEQKELLMTSSKALTFDDVNGLGQWPWSTIMSWIPSVLIMSYCMTKM